MQKCAKMNGPVDGLCDRSLSEEGAFMFTSESVGEGHPGKQAVVGPWQPLPGESFYERP